ncbi:acrosin isoform X2 [Oryzias latipes]|uniref:acrosin isoform X2 n=1 Tax=Oryzias latipes TaxID=8090 RepID=UPI0009DAFF64|nr:acrosin isoform X2 [Oryzias latipes]
MTSLAGSFVCFKRVQKSFKVNGVQRCRDVSERVVCYCASLYTTQQIFRSHVRVVAGLRVWSDPGAHSQIRYISEMKMHEDYDDFTSDSDIMLLRLRSPFNFTSHVQPACTPYSVTHEFVLNFTHCFITGWGSSYYKGRLMNNLQEAEVELIERRRCNQFTWYDGFITENMLCAGLESGAADSCQGDSGGALQCYSESDDRFYVVGVTSFGEECGLPRRPGVYSRISRFADWLKAVQAQAAAATAHRLRVALISPLLSTVLMLLSNQQ